ncbi:MAG: hypothetical protein JW795_10885 [Chitinivibrionales bacterium]|nr:hypothetical protein [Chitinivibrionales bacterium]
MNIRTLFISALSLAAGLYLFCTNEMANKPQTGSGTETVGICRDTTGNAVKDAFVHIYYIRAKDTLTHFTGKTNTLGLFSIRVIHGDSLYGQYQLFAITHDTSLVSKTTFILNKNENPTDTLDTLNIGIITMRKPGFIQGRVSLNGEYTGGVEIDLSGFSFMAKSNDSGNFLIANIFPGIYDVRYMHQGYKTDYDRQVEVKSGLVTSMQTKNLVYDTAGAPPAPIRLSAVYDTMAGTVHLQWRRVAIADLLKYEIFNALDDASSPISIGFSKNQDTLFNHVVFSNLSDTSNHSCCYQVKTIDTDNNSSVFSQKCQIQAASPTLVVTTFTITVRDSIKVGTPFKIIVDYKNPTRINDSLIWKLKRKSPDTVRVKSSAVHSKSGNDTLVHTFTATDSGTVTLVVEAIDNGGHRWSTAVSLTVKGPVKIDEFENYSPLVAARSRHCAATIDSTIYCLGGQRSLTSNNIPPLILKSMESLNRHDTVWNSTSDMMLDTGRADFSVAVVSGKLYVIGGRLSNESFSRSIVAYDPKIKQWSAVAQLPYTLFFHASCVYKDKIYIFGGCSIELPAVQSNRIVVFDPQKLEVKDLGEKMIRPRYSHQVISTNDRIYIIGGVSDSSPSRYEAPQSSISRLLSNTSSRTENTNTCIEEFDPATEKCISFITLPTPRLGFGAAGIDNCLYIFGGISNNAVLNKTEMLNLKTKLWQTKKSLSNGRAYFAVSVMDGIIYIIGGSTKVTPDGSEGDQINAVLRYYP